MRAWACSFHHELHGQKLDISAILKIFAKTVDNGFCHSLQWTYRETRNKTTREAQTMKFTRGKEELERNISKLFGVDLFNAIYYFDDCKTRRGTFNRLIKMNKLQFDGKVAATKRTCLLLIETLDAIRERDKTFKETQYKTLKVHYNALCNYVSSL